MAASEIYTVVTLSLALLMFCSGNAGIVVWPFVIIWMALGWVPAIWIAERI